MTLRRRGTELGSPPIGDGDAQRTGITDDMHGIRFEVDRMTEYVRYYSRDPLVVRTVELIIQACEPKNKECHINALFQWVKANFLFLHDPVDAEKIKTAPRCIRELATPKEILGYVLQPILPYLLDGQVPGAAIQQPMNKVLVHHKPMEDLSWVPDPKVVEDCDGAATFLATLLAAAGIVPRFTFGGKWDVEAGKKVCAWHHVWVQALLKDQWIDLDPTELPSTVGWKFPGFTCYDYATIFKPEQD